MTKILISIMAIVAALVTSTAYAKQDHKVTICHATSSAENPYNRIVVDEHAIGGHFDNPGTPKAGHEDDLFFDGEHDCPAPEPQPDPTPTPTPTPDPDPNPTPDPDPQPNPDPEPPRDDNGSSSGGSRSGSKAKTSSDFVGLQMPDLEPQVLEATTTLPVTGFPPELILVVLGGVVIIIAVVKYA